MTIIHSFLGRMRNKLYKKQSRGMEISIETVNHLKKVKFEIGQKEVPTPEVLNMQFLDDAKHLHQAKYNIPEIYTTVLENVLYCPKYNILLSDKRKIIIESINTALVGDVDYNFLIKAEIKTLPGWSTLFRSLHNNFYHSLIDNIPRTFLLVNDENFSKNEVLFLSPSPLKGTEAFFLEKILGMNPNINVLDSTYLYKVEKLIFPSFLTQRFAGFLPSPYLNYLLPKLLPSRASKKNKRIYISRSKTLKRNARSITNEQELLDLLQPLGFEKYFLEELPFQDQIELFYDAEIVIGPHGAGFTNLLFAGPINLIELFPTQQVVPHYYYLSKSLNQHYFHWCGEEKNRKSNFRVDVEAIRQIVKEIV